jgi:hypothetical protein
LRGTALDDGFSADFVEPSTCKFLDQPHYWSASQAMLKIPAEGRARSAAAPTWAC